MIELAKEYNSQGAEPKINKLWDESGFFNPDNLDLPADAKTYTIILPPPNVTDRLHLGHASMVAVEDLMIRFHRLNGYRTLWLPGTDHAAIATQTVVEKKLYKETGKTRHDLGRVEFLKEVNKFALATQATILGQIKSMGASLDWSRLAFTLDETRQKAVRQMFVNMYEAGVLYRGERIVNWCPRCQSTLADDEVEYKEETTTLYTFKYDKDFPIEISTTRPETKLGDTAVAVNPKDERYKKYIGQTFTADFCGQELTLKVIADREVEMEFGTGALGVTPAHSMIDWRMALDNDLVIIKVINEQGLIEPGLGIYSGKTVKEAREMIIENLKVNDLIIKEEEVSHSLSVCYRCGTPIEPLPSLQWFVDVNKPLAKLNNKSLKQVAIEVAEKKEVTFVPERFTKRYLDWMNNLRDWCVSRQIWFGHQVPVWYKAGEVYVGVNAPIGTGWEQEEGTLDTWFSSGMWTFSTLGWPDNLVNNNKTGDLARFHPTQVLDTGYEIITLWISRMIMMSAFALGEIPFEKVYLHGMILDSTGKKMSKSKGNGIDPVVVTAKYGNDAVRLALLLGNTPGVDIRVSEEKIASFRNFTNKLWNISRYILAHEESSEKFDISKMTLTDKWIISRLEKTTTDVTDKIKSYEFSEAGETLRDFTLNDLADWYLEASKFENSSQKIPVLNFVLENILKLWHPFMPFVTETIWQTYHQDLLMVATWPQVDEKLIDEKIEKDFSLIQNTIVAIRNLRSEHKLPPADKAKVYLYVNEKLDLFNNFSILIKSLRTSVSDLIISANGERIDNALYDSNMGIDIFIEAQVDQAKEMARLDKEIINKENFIKLEETTLANKEFTDKAPKEIISLHEKKLAQAKLELEKLSQERKSLK